MRTEAYGKLRRFRKAVSISTERLEKLRDNPPKPLLRDLESLVLRGSEKGRERAAARLRSAFPMVFSWHRMERGLLGAYMASVDPVILTPTDAGQTQKAIVVNYLIIGIADIGVATGLWTLEIPDHALIRAIERDPYGVIETKISEAHKTLLNASILSIYSQEFLIPTPGPGFFVAEWIFGTDNKTQEKMVYARVRTWIHDDQIYDAQLPRVIKPAEEGTKRLADELMKPIALQAILKPTDADKTICHAT